MIYKENLRIVSESKAKKNEINNKNRTHFNMIIHLYLRIVTPLICGIIVWNSDLQLCDINLKLWLAFVG